MKFNAPTFLIIATILANSALCAQQFSGLPVLISESPLFESTGNTSWPYAITLTTPTDGASSQEEQTLDINVTGLPVGAEYRVLRSMSDGSFFNGDPQALSVGSINQEVPSNAITINAVEFDRTVKVQFSSGAIIFNNLFVNSRVDLNISIDDFAGLNTEANTNNLAISVTENGLGLILGPGSSTLGRDAFGTGTSKFGQAGAWFDGSYVKFGNSGNQQILDLRIINNTGTDAKLKNISFDLRRPPANANFATDFQLLYLATGDSELIKGFSVADGNEMVNLVPIGSDVLEAGINNFSEFIGQNISGTAWIADGGYANIRLKLNTTAQQAATQLDNLVISLEILEILVENSDDENSNDENLDEANSDEADSNEADSNEADSGEVDSGKADSNEADSDEADSDKADSGEVDSGEEERVQAWYQNVTNLGNDWIRSAWLGDFRVRSDPWIYHIEHGWMYVFSNSTYSEGIYFWDDAMKEILWTSKTAYPIQYRFSDKKWIWYLKESKNPRFFVDLATSEWEEHD